MFCKNCGGEMSESAKACPSCGHPSASGDKKNKVVFVLLALLLGGLGIHRFYLGGGSNVVLGLLMICFVWSGIPSLIALVEAIVIGLRKDDPRFE